MSPAPLFIKMFKRKPSFKTPPCILLFIFYFSPFFSVVLSPSPDNPPHPWLISRKGTGQQCAQGSVLKMHVLPLNTHCSSQGTRLSPSCGGDNHRQIKTRTQGNDMHDYCLHAHMVDQCWRWGHFLSGEQINIEEAEAMQVRGCVRLCRKEGLLRMGGLLPANRVYVALCLPINWPCGASPAGQAATESSQVLWENRTTALHSLRGVKKSDLNLFVYLFFSQLPCAQHSHSNNMGVKDSAYSVWAAVPQRC